MAGTAIATKVGTGWVPTICMAVMALCFALVPDRAAAQNAPYQTQEGRGCIEQWTTEAMRRLNTYDEPGEHNLGKPYSINEYGVTVGRKDFSNFQPDDWNDYGRDRLTWIWAKYQINPDVGWRWRQWNNARVPGVNQYVRDCLASTGSTTASGPTTPPAPVGAGCSVCGAGAAPATSELRQACNEYAQIGVDQTNEYNRRGCSGGRPEWWNTTLNFHYNYCIGRYNNPTPWEGRIMRQRVLDQCSASTTQQSSVQACRKAASGVPQRLDNGWCRVCDRGISFNNEESLRNVTLEQCLQLCDERPWCKSLEHHRENNVCMLAKVTAWDMKLTDQPGNAFDHYTRDCGSLGL